MMCAFVIERETDRQTHTERETERDTERETQRERQRETETQRETDDRDRERQRETETERYQKKKRKTVELTGLRSRPFQMQKKKISTAIRGFFLLFFLLFLQDSQRFFSHTEDWNSRSL